MASAGKDSGKDAVPAGSIDATYRHHPRGFGFATPTVPDQVATGDVFVPPPVAAGLLDGDQLTVTVTADARGRTATAVHRIVRPSRLVVVTVRPGGRLDCHPRFGTVTWTADGPAARLPVGQQASVVVPAGRPTAATPGTIRDIVAGPYPPDDASTARLEAVAAADDPAHRPADAAATLHLDVAAATQADRQLAAATAGSQPPVTAGRGDRNSRIPGAGLRRDDRRQLPTITIDGSDTCDLDDAISASTRADGTIEVQVHIADVAAHVPAGSALDRHAATLATSVYLADHVRPMLPPALSEGRCSLQPHQDRDALTVTFDVDADGRSQLRDIAATMIRSDRKATYRQTQRHLDGRRTRLDAATRTLLDAAADAAGRLAAGRGDTFDRLFDRPSITTAIVGGHLQPVADGDDHDAHQLIERLMVATNQHVATYMSAHGIPSLYRQHGGMVAAELDPLRAAALRAHIPLDETALADPARQAGELARVTAAADDTTGKIMAATAASAMGRAGYGTDLQAHAGLGIVGYSHFTSPIRRYADLVVHRNLRAALAGEPPVHAGAELAAAAVWITARAGHADRVEAVQRSLLAGRLLEQGRTDGRSARGTATVVKLAAAGTTVRFTSHGLVGFLPAGQLGGRLTISGDGLATCDGRIHLGQRRQVRFAALDATGRPTFAAA